MTNKYGFMNEEEMKYVQACLEFAVQLGQIADVSFWNGHRELFTRYQGDSFSYDEVATVIKKRIREKEYEQEIQNILRKQH